MIFDISLLRTPLSGLLSRFTKDKTETREMLPVVDMEGNIIGKARRGECHFNPQRKILHPVVHMHVFNDRNEIYLQHRLMTKKVQPGKWDTAVGGHVSFGESIEFSLHREAGEEIGIKDFVPELVKRYLWETEVEKELVYMFVCNVKGRLKVNGDEISDGRFWSFSEVRENLGKGVFTPSFETEFAILSEERRKGE